MTSIIDIIHPFYNSKVTPIARYNASALYDWVEKEATRQGVACPKLHLVHHELPNAGGYFDKAQKVGNIYITRGNLSHIHNNPNLNHHVPDGLKALLAHEMSHIRDMTHSIDSVNFRRYTMYSMPLIALAGYEIYQNIQKRRKENPSKSLSEHFSDAVEDIKKTNFLSLDPVMKYIQVDAQEWGRRLAAMAIGLGVGGFTARQISLGSEFRADRAAVAASGFNPEIYIKCMAESHKVSERLIKPQLKEWKNKFIQRPFWDKVNEIYQAIAHDLSGITYHAHPGNTERFRAMRDYAKLASPAPHSL